MALYSVLFNLQHVCAAQVVIATKQPGSMSQRASEKLLVANAYSAFSSMEGSTKASGKSAKAKSSSSKR